MKGLFPFTTSLFFVKDKGTDWFIYKKKQLLKFAIELLLNEHK